MRERPGHPPRVVALDLGKARVGVAISDELGLLAHPRPALDGRDRKTLLATLVEMAKDEGVTRFLVGLPLSMSGEHGIKAAQAEAFAAELARAAGVPVELLDERWTTVQAARQLRDSGVDARAGKARIDGVAAAVMLQSWLDARRGDAGPAPLPDLPPPPAPPRGRGGKRGR
jgi:putative Holliday junction resolvase